MLHTGTVITTVTFNTITTFHLFALSLFFVALLIINYRLSATEKSARAKGPTSIRMVNNLLYDKNFKD